MHGVQAQRSQRLRSGVWRESDSEEGDEPTKIEVTYSTRGGSSRARSTLGTLIVCIIQVQTKLGGLSAPSRVTRHNLSPRDSRDLLRRVSHNHLH